MIYNTIPVLLWMAQDKKDDRSSQATTVAKKKKAKETQVTSMKKTAEQPKAGSKRLRFRAWLQRKLPRGHSTTTKIIKTTTQASPACHSSAPRALDETKILQSVLVKRDTILNASTPPAYDDQGAPPPLHIGLPREDEIRIMKVVDNLMGIAHTYLTRRFDLVTLLAIAAGVREGCISAAATVCQVTLQKTVVELNDIIYKGCYEAAKAVIAAVAAAPEGNWIGVADGAATYIAEAARHHTKYKRRDQMSYAAAAQLATTVHSVAATISFRVANENYVLSDIPLPIREEFLLKL